MCGWGWRSRRDAGRFYDLAAILTLAPEAFEAVIPLPDFARLLAADVVQLTDTSSVRYGSEWNRVRRSSTGTRTDGVWRLRFHQGTPVPLT
jgi:hypothetical protein